MWKHMAYLHEPTLDEKAKTNKLMQLKEPKLIFFYSRGENKQ